MVFLLAANNQHSPQLEKICEYLYPRQSRKCCLLGKVADRVNCSKESRACSWRTSHILPTAIIYMVTCFNAILSGWNDLCWGSTIGCQCVNSLLTFCSPLYFAAQGNLLLCVVIQSCFYFPLLSDMSLYITPFRRGWTQHCSM